VRAGTASVIHPNSSGLINLLLYRYWAWWRSTFRSHPFRLAATSSTSSVVSSLPSRRRANRFL
jgi:hypothetical protein